jgi:hypothetical protein
MGEGLAFWAVNRHDFASEENSMDGLIFGSATRQAQAIRAREVSSEELVKACIARIDAVNPTLNAVVQLPRATTLGQARQADAALARGETLGPLHGVPFTLKDDRIRRCHLHGRDGRTNRFRTCAGRHRCQTIARRRRNPPWQDQLP